MSRWFKAVKPAKPMIAAEEDQHLQEAEQALLQLLNDNIEAADKALKNGQSSYHHLGRGISGFIAAMLGAEKDLLKGAAAILQDAETRTWEDMKRSQRDATAFRSEIYPPGTEYLLCYSICQLTSAICNVLSGSVTEAIRGFMKLRKAYQTLDGIMQIESKYLKAKMAGRRYSVTSTLLSRQPTGKSLENGSSHFDGDYEKAQTSMNGNLQDESALLDELDNSETQQPIRPTFTRTQSRLLDVEPESVGIKSHTDIFIHSGTRLCFGILLLVFSMIENPMFNRILYIVGFSGDRERGTRYLWQAARFDNFNSAIAGFVLLGFYNNFIMFSDILPTDSSADDDLAGYPKTRCLHLLANMRKRYPDSKFWKLEEARMYSANRNLAASIKILVDNGESHMKQVATINVFELSLTSMFHHDYELCSKSWIQCAELSSWSPCLYHYQAGIAYLEIYRDLRLSDPKQAEVYKKKATESIRKAPPLAGKQKVMGKELPFDMYVRRKVLKWEERAKSWKVDLVDATGTSPVTEMIFLWNGMKKQGPEELQKSLDKLSWARTGKPERFEKDVDEQAVHAAILASVLRNLGRYEEARETLNNHILNHERPDFRGPDKDDWTHPTAFYEMAALAWAEKDIEDADHQAKVLECEQWLDKVKNYPEPYVLDNRLSMKVTTSIVTVKRHKSMFSI